MTQQTPAPNKYFLLEQQMADGTYRRVVDRSTGKQIKHWAAVYATPDEIAKRYCGGGTFRVSWSPDKRSRPMEDPVLLHVAAEIPQDREAPPAPPVPSAAPPSSSARTAAAAAPPPPAGSAGPGWGAQPTGPTPRNPPAAADPLHYFERIADKLHAKSDQQLTGLMAITQVFVAQQDAAHANALQAQRDFTLQLEQIRAGQADQLRASMQAQASHAQQQTKAYADQINSYAERLDEVSAQSRAQEVELVKAELQAEIEALRNDDDKTISAAAIAALEDAGPDVLREIAPGMARLMVALATKVNKGQPVQMPGGEVHDAPAAAE